jgi:hypothetical protein
MLLQNLHLHQEALHSYSKASHEVFWTTFAERLVSELHHGLPVRYHDKSGKDLHLTRCMPIYVVGYC